MGLCTVSLFIAGNILRDIEVDFFALGKSIDVEEGSVCGEMVRVPHAVDSNERYTKEVRRSARTWTSNIQVVFCSMVARDTAYFQKIQILNPAGEARSASIVFNCRDNGTAQTPTQPPGQEAVSTPLPAGVQSEHKPVCYMFVLRCYVEVEGFTYTLPLPHHQDRVFFLGPAR